MDTFWYRLTEVYLEKMAVKTERENIAVMIDVLSSFVGLLPNMTWG